MQIKFKNDGTIQINKNGNGFVNLFCPITGETCKHACINVDEPTIEESLAYFYFNCGSNGMQYLIPDTDFIDERGS